MYIQNTEFDLRERLGDIRDRTSIWAIIWILIAVQLFALSIYHHMTGVEYHATGEKCYLGIFINVALMISCVGVIVTVVRVSRFAKYRLNRTTEFPAGDHKRIYGEEKKG